MIVEKFSFTIPSVCSHAQVQHNMWVTHLQNAVLSNIIGGGKWVEVTIPMDPLYLSVLVSAEKKFCVQSGPHRRHERIEFLGGICRPVPRHPRGISRHRPWGAWQTLQ